MNVKALREKKNWSREELAARLDVSATAIGNWERGGAMFKKHERKLNKIFNIKKRGGIKQ